MSSAVDKIFGSPGKTRAGPNKKDIQKAINFVTKYSQQARTDIFDIAPQAMQNRLLGSQGALDVFKQGIPQQLSAFLGGNINAQQTTAAGLPQQIAAMMGQPVDLSGLQAQQTPANMDWLQNIELPQFDTSLPDTQNPPEGVNPAVLAWLQSVGRI